MSKILRSLFLTLSFTCIFPLTARAQVSADGTTATTVKQDGDNFTIEEGDRAGDNLFHSFDEFSVPSQGSATFNNAGDIVNIFSRVTGSSISNIDGILSANGAANLYLINPNGIIFGENASLNLGGSFFASTADSLLFESGKEFSASNPQASPLLEVSIPVGLNFRDNSGDIINRSIVQDNDQEVIGLEVSPGNNISFIGGNFNFEGGNITASGGDIFLGAISESGTVDIAEDGSLSLAEDILRGDITLSNGSEVDVTGSGGGNITVDVRNLKLEGGEREATLLRAGIRKDSTSIDAQAGNITIDATGDISLINGGELINSTFGSGNAGNITINARDSISIKGQSEDNNSSTVSSRAERESERDSGNITFSTGSLSIEDGAFISNSILGSGNAGEITVNAVGDVTIDGVGPGDETPSSISSSIFDRAEGEGGNIIVNVSEGSLLLSNGGKINANVSGLGDGGAINIEASENISIDGENSQSGDVSIISSEVETEGEGNAGSITISTTNLDLTAGGRVDATTSGQGNAGEINITAEGDITADGVRPSSNDPSGIISQVAGSVEGERSSGGVTISTANLRLTNGGRVSATTFGQGNAGEINIAAEGDITADGVRPSSNDPSEIASQVNPEGEGDAGSITISTANLRLTNGGRVDATTFGQGNAGEINITAEGDITADGVRPSSNAPSQIASQVADSVEGERSSGGVTISTANLRLTNGGRVDATTFGQGNAGEINITAKGDITADGVRPSVDPSGMIPSGINSQVGGDAIGDAGGITIFTTNLDLTAGGQVAATTFSQGDAGALTITATESIRINGRIGRFRSGISANALNENGNGGNLSVTVDNLSIANGGSVEATNFNNTEFERRESGTGRPGNIDIDASSIELTDNARIEAGTQFVGEEGSANINLSVSKEITLEDNSLISAEAREKANGGNLRINTNDGFILAFPNGNSDIIASADRGNGGEITIFTQALFGIEERSSMPDNFTNDIDASSELGLQGDFSLNTPDFDPTSGLLELPEAVGDASDQISQNPCEQGVGSEFLVTGKGGLPANPNETLNSDRVKVGLIEPVPSQQQARRSNNTDSESSPSEPVPVRGWIFNEKGKVIFTAYATEDTPTKRSEQKHHSTCSSET